MLEGQGRGIIMEVTRPLLLGPQTNPPAVYYCTKYSRQQGEKVPFLLDLSSTILAPLIINQNTSLLFPHYKMPRIIDLLF